MNVSIKLKSQGSIYKVPPGCSFLSRIRSSASNCENKYLVEVRTAFSRLSECWNTARQKMASKLFSCSNAVDCCVEKDTYYPGPFYDILLCTNGWYLYQWLLQLANTYPKKKPLHRWRNQKTKLQELPFHKKNCCKCRKDPGTGLPLYNGMADEIAFYTLFLTIIAPCKTRR